MRAVRTIAIGFGVLVVGSWSSWVWAGGRPGPEDLAIVGEEIFQRRWVANDPRSRGGDGLGPVYNANSCLACHNQKGPGGGGGMESNVEILTPIVSAGNARPAADQLLNAVREITGFPTAGSVVLHKFGTDPKYLDWRKGVPSRNGEKNGITLSLRTSARNTPALFGAGLIDTIPSHVIESQAAPRGVTEFPEIHGRVGHVPGGKVGRFGWKAQTPNLRDFVLTACSVELGLEVPEHSQSPNPLKPEAVAQGLDLTALECDALVAYVASLPAPGRRTPLNTTQAETANAGAHVFEAIGCAGCHTPSLGDVDNIYSDLLLHDMGESLADAATYYGVPSPGDTADPLPGPLADGTTPVAPPASRQEWRTPPLWGVRDSAPYLHDGRAPTLEAAITSHSGEAHLTVERYRSLGKAERVQLRVFLMSLTAPKSPAAEKAPRASSRRVATSDPSLTSDAIIRAGAL